MNPEDLANVQPAWKSLPSVPTRIAGDGASVDFRPCGFSDGAKVDSLLPEKEVPQNSPSMNFYCWKEGQVGKIKIKTGGDFVPIQ